MYETCNSFRVVGFCYYVGNQYYVSYALMLIKNLVIEKAASMLEETYSGMKEIYGYELET